MGMTVQMQAMDQTALHQTMYRKGATLQKELMVLQLRVALTEQ